MPTQEKTDYVCRLTNLIFKEPCTVTSCFAHVSNLNQAGVKVIGITNCAHADFALHGFSENIDYAVEEQGFVGFRDLQYMATFFNIHANELRELYTDNVAMFRKGLALLWAANNNQHTNHCPKCGHPLKSTQVTCTSASLCEERFEAVSDLMETYTPMLPTDKHVKLYNIVWRSLVEKFSPAIYLSEDERTILEDLKGN